MSNIALWVKNQKKSVVIDLKTKIKDFEEKYKKLWFPKNEDDTKTSLKKNQLQAEVIGLIDKLKNTSTRHLAMLEREESIFLQMVEEQDIKKFVKEMWKTELV